MACADAPPSDGMRRWQSFVANFKTQHFDAIASDDLKRLSRLPVEHLCEFPLLMLHGCNSKTLMRMFAREVLGRIFGSDSPDADAPRTATYAAASTTVPYASSSAHVELDFDGMDTATAGAAISEFFAKHIGGSRCYAAHASSAPKKHIVVMFNLDTLPQRCVMSLRKTIETCSHNVVCIATCLNASKLNDALRSRCAFVRCNVSADSEAALVALLAAPRQPTKHTKNTRGTMSTLPCRIIAAADGEEADPADPADPEIGCLRFVRRFVAYDLKACESVLDAVPAIRKFVQTLVRMHVPIATAMRVALETCLATTPDHNVSVSLIAAAAHHQHAIVMMSNHKPHVALEAFFVRVYCECLRPLATAK